MDGKGTGLALAVMGATAALALLLIHIAWKRTDIHDHMLGAVLGIIQLGAVLAMALLFLAQPGNRRPSVFFLVFFLLLTLPGSGFLLARAHGGLRMELYQLDAPGMPPTLPYLLPCLVLVGLIFMRLVSWSMTFEPVPGARTVSAQELRQRLLILNDGAAGPCVPRPPRRPVRINRPAPPVPGPGRRSGRRRARGRSRRGSGLR